MDTPKIYESEYRFCLILWAHEPIKSSELVKLCAQQLGWKPTTTYTVIKRLSQRGVLKNENTVVTSLISKEAVQAADWWKRPLRVLCPPFWRPSPAGRTCPRRRWRRSGASSKSEEGTPWKLCLSSCCS